MTQKNINIVQHSSMNFTQELTKEAKTNNKQLFSISDTDNTVSENW